MDKSTTPDNFDIQDADNHLQLISKYAGEVDWEPLRIKPNDFDIQASDGTDESEGKREYAGEVGTWERIATVIMRNIVTCIVLGLLIYGVAQNFWFLSLLIVPILVPLSRGIASYYYLRWLEKPNKRK